MAKEAKYDTSSSAQKSTKKTLFDLMKNTPIQDAEILSNLELFMGRMELQNILYFNELYQKILNVHGVIMEFGTRYGHNLALFSALRGIYEPYVASRKIIAFDSFAGFPSVAPEDGAKAAVGDLATPEGYASYLEQVLQCHAAQSPIAHKKRFELVTGDAPVELEKYLQRQPETMVAFVNFDLDLYQPTKACLEILRDYLPKGAVLSFDQLCYENFPGETKSIRDVFGLKNIHVHRTPYSSSAAYLILD